MTLTPPPNASDPMADTGIPVTHTPPQPRDGAERYDRTGERWIRRGSRWLCPYTSRREVPVEAWADFHARYGPFTEHRQVSIEHPVRGQTFVDYGLHQLLAAAWAAGIDTVASCQEGDTGQDPYIAFPDVDNAARFAGIAVDVIVRGCASVDGPGATVHFPTEAIPGVTERLRAARVLEPGDAPDPVPAAKVTDRERTAALLKVKAPLGPIAQAIDTAVNAAYRAGQEAGYAAAMAARAPADGEVAVRQEYRTWAVRHPDGAVRINGDQGWVAWGGYKTAWPDAEAVVRTVHITAGPWRAPADGDLGYPVTDDVPDLDAPNLG